MQTFIFLFLNSNSISLDLTKMVKIIFLSLSGCSMLWQPLYRQCNRFPLISQKTYSSSHIHSNNSNSGSVQL
jgi:hypothetical protein